MIHITNPFPKYAKRMGHPPTERNCEVLMKITELFGRQKKAKGERLFQAALEAGQRNDDDSGIRYLESAAECGSRDAKYELGGIALRTDPQKAYRLFVEAAQDGNPKAAHNLGVMFRDGMGIRQDDAKACHWFELGARLGYAASKNSLGLSYRNGLGVGRDLEKALQLFTEAARQGDADAGFNLATMYLGWGIDEDERTAIYWLQDSARHGGRIAAEALRDRDPMKYMTDYLFSHLRRK